MNSSGTGNNLRNELQKLQEDLITLRRERT